MSVPISTLKPLKKRIFGTHSYSKKFGSTAPINLPATLGRVRMTMPDQQSSDFCTAYGEAVSSGYKWNIPMSAAWQTAMESKYYGYPILQGADAAGSMDAALVYDSLPAINCSFTLQNEDENYIANPSNYDSSLQKLATPYFPGIPYKVDGQWDIFDNIRSALYQEWILDKAVVKVFGYWYQSWSDQAVNPDNHGHVITPTDQPITLHRYNFIDWITDESGIVYLVAALTQGNKFGDNGHLYMNRDCVNQVFSSIQEDGLGLYIGKPSSFDLPTTMALFRVILNYLK